MSETKTKYPAPFLAHWATGPVACCEKHANGLVKLGGFMGSHVAVTVNTDESLECSNCKDEAENEAT